MKSYTISLILFVIAVFSNLFVNAQSLQYKVASYEDMVQNAAKSRRPFIIIFEHKECKECEVFENTTLKTEMLTDFLDANFTVYKVDAFSYEGVGTVQAFDVTDYPSVMIFNTDGVRLSSVSGLYDANEFHKQLKYAIQGMPAMSKPANISTDLFNTELSNEDATLAIQEAKRQARAAKEAVVNHLDAKAMELTAEEMEVDQLEETVVAEAAFADVPGLAKYSVKDKKPEGFAIKINQVSDPASLKTEVAVYEKKWKGPIWVYTFERNNTKQYCLALGLYEEKESAQYIRRLLFQNFSISGSIISLGEIRY